MKKKFFVLLILLCFLIQSCYGAMVTIVERDISYSFTKTPGNTVTLEAKDECITTWEVKSGGIVLDENNSFVMPDNDVKIEAVYSESTKYLLITNIFGEITRIKKEAGEEVTISVPEKEGYTFNKWTASGMTLDADQEVSQTLTFIMPSNLVTLTAEYSSTTYTVTFNANGGIGEIASQTFNEGQQKSLNKNTFTKSGNFFIGWSTTNVGEVEYEDEASYIATEDTTLYAVWKEIVYGDVNGDGEVSVADLIRISQYLSNKENTEIILENSDLNADGEVDEYDKFILAGYIGSDIEALPYDGKVVIFSSSSNLSAGKYQFFANGETKPLEPSEEITKTGYTLVGWATTYGGGKVYELRENYTANSNITLYTVWEEEVYTITYDLAGGAVLSSNPTTYKVSTSSFTLNNPSKEGHTFLGWSGTDIEGLSKTVTIEKGSTGNRTYTANWQVNTYTVTFNSNDGSDTTKTQSFIYNVPQNLEENTFVREGYTFSGWATTSTGTVIYADKASCTAKGDVTLYAIWEEVDPWNAPVLGTSGELVPVKWNGSAWVETTEDDWDYNYDIATANTGEVEGDGTAKWANAMTEDGSLYVWIPRYTYKITSGENQAATSWSSDLYASNNTKGEIKVIFSTGVNDTEGTSQGYIKHPAFTFGDDELEGIWVAKYEASRNDATSSSAGSGITATSKPGVVSWRNLSVSDAYKYAYSLNRKLDSHLMRNREWGAVAYLTNAVGRIPYINNSSDFITGNAGKIQDATDTDETYAWNTAQGVKASTTHNVYGIYDLSGGAWEYVAAYYTGGSSTFLSQDEENKEYGGALYANRNTKYVEAYEVGYDSSGDAIYETSNSSSQKAWDNDTEVEPNSYSSVFFRGGYYNSNSSSGIFFFSVNTGNALNAGGYRTALAIKSSGELTSKYLESIEIVTPPTKTSYNVGEDFNAAGMVVKAIYTDGTEGTITGYSIVNGTSLTETQSSVTITYEENGVIKGVNQAITVANTTYTVTFDSNNGTGGTTTQSFTSNVAQNLSLNMFLKLGYTFLGWSTTSTGTVEYLDGASYTATSDITLYAVWEVETYTVTFNSNYGTANTTTQSFTPSVAQNLRTNTFVREGYTFSGWSTTSTGTVKYADGASYTATSNTTLYAVWKANTYTVTFNSNYGTVSTTTQSFTYGTAKTLKANTFTREGYTFSGWSTTSTGAVEYLDGASYTATSNTTLYAVWEVNTYTVTFNSNYGTTSTTTQSFTYNVAQNLTTNTFTREGYTFSGWSTTSTGAVEYLDGASYTATSNVTLYAVWEISLASLPVGTYIKYDVPSTKTYEGDWVLFKNNSGQLDIISKESVEDFTITYRRGDSTYYDCVKDLNELCSLYVNSTYATNARSLGSAGTSTGSISGEATESNSSKFPYTDTLYESDVNIINTQINGEYPLRHTSGTVWLASRAGGTFWESNDYKLWVRSLSADGTASYSNAGGLAGSSTAYYEGSTYGVRPVISLYTSLTIESGSGTQSDPYVLKK